MKALFAATLLMAAALAQAMPEAARRSGMLQSQDWKQWGSGEMRWLGFALYDATLYVAGQDVERAPLALHLRYRRDIPGTRLVQTSLDEMRRLGADAAQLLRWEPELARVFPDVATGETITGVRLPGQGVRFFHQDSARGEIADPEFGRLFFAIWLDARTRSPAVRALLLQGPKAPS